MIKIAFDPIYAHPLPEGHRFPMLKYELIPAQLLHEGSITNEQLFSPMLCDTSWVLQVHDKDYVNRLLNLQLTPSEERKIGFPVSERLINREWMITQGTIDCCIFALQHGIALNVAGGTHHAFANRGEGFCILNDMAIASKYLLENKLAKKILVIDVDVHQGNGTAKLMENEPRVFTFSIHGQHNYPFIKEKSDCDVGLEDGCTTEHYLQLLQYHLSTIIQKFQPDFAFYQSGVDILETDAFGKLKVTMQGCKERDEFVFKILHQLAIPVTVVMGGGYSPSIRTIVEAHCNTFRTALNIWG